MDCSTPGLPVFHHLLKLKFMSIKLVMPSNYLICCCSLLLPPSFFPSIRSLFQWVGLFISGQSIGASVSASVLSVDIQGWFPLGLTGLISLQSKRLWRVFSSTSVGKHQFFGARPSPLPSSHICTWLLEKPSPLPSSHIYIALTIWTFVCKVISLIFNMLSRLVIAFLPRSKHLLISQHQSPSAVILEPPKIKSLSISIVSPSVCHEVMGPDATILVFGMLSFKPTCSLSSFTFIKGFFSSSSRSAIRVVPSAYLRLLMFLRQFWLQLSVLNHCN